METIHKNDKAIKEYFDNLSDVDLQNFYNAFAEQHSYERVYTNDSDFLNMTYSTPDKAANAIEFGDYRTSDNFVTFDGYGNLESTCNIRHLIDVEQLQDDAHENPERYNIEFIDPNDLSDEELFNYLKENDAFIGVPNSDEYSELWTRERLETVACEQDLV